MVSASLGSITTLVPNGLSIVYCVLKSFSADGLINARASGRVTDKMAGACLYGSYYVSLRVSEYYNPIYTMKKIHLLLAAMAVIAVAACQKPAAGNPEDENIPGYSEKDDPNRPSGKDDVTVSTEEYIEQTAKELMDALNWDKWSSEAEYIHKVVLALKEKNFKDSKIEEWAEALAESWEQEPRKEGSLTIYDNIVRLSDAKGHFEEQPDGSITFTEANDLMFTILVDGEKVSATYTGTDTNVPIRFFGSKTLINYDYETGQEYGEAHNTYVYVPESVTLKILRGTAEFASLVLNMKADVKDPEQVNPYTDSATLDLTFKIGVYTLSLQKVAYSPTGASAYVKLLSGNASLITVDAKGTYELDPASNASVPLKSGTVNASIDVLGKIQVKGDIPDVVKFMNTGESLNSKNNDGNAYKAIVAELEKSCSAAMYFNGSSTARATLGFEAVKSGGDYEYWYCNPVLRFPDGTSIGIEDYVTGDKFRNVTNYAENWWNGIERYVSNLFSDI